MAKYNTIGERIKELRHAQELSQMELARKLNCTQAALSQYESGNREPGLQEIVLISQALQTTTDYLLGITNIKSVDTDVKMIGDYLGLTEESIDILRGFYWDQKQKLSEEYLQNEVRLHSGAIPGDKTYDEDFASIQKYEQLNLDAYIKFINEFICSSEFKVLSSCLSNNLYIERTIYDIFRIAVNSYEDIESELFTSNIAEKAWALLEDSENLIQEYSLNIFEAQTAILDFCKNFTHLEKIKKLDYEESLYRKVVFLIYHYISPMVKSGNFYAKKLTEELSKDEFNLRSKIIKLLNDV